MAYTEAAPVVRETISNSPYVPRVEHPTTTAAVDQQTKITRSLEGAVTSQLSKLEQILEYLKVLYR